MDMLCVPDDASIPVPRTPYVGKEIWDCGPFLSYAHRKQLLRRVPPRIRYPDPAIDIPYLELIHPSPKEDNEAFYQTWLFFGLIAECLRLNEHPDGGRRVELSDARQQCRTLYDECVVEDDGRRYVSGSRAFAVLQPLLQAWRQGGAEALRGDLDHFHACISLTNGMIRAIHSKFDDSIRFSISALGELLSTLMHTMLVAAAEPISKEAVKFALSWFWDYPPPGSQLESDMIKLGWCRSEIERVRNINHGLGTVHYVSRLNRDKAPLRVHLSCTEARCQAFQINEDTYQLQHAKNGCNCTGIYEINVQAIQEVLQQTKSYPILRLDYSNGGKVKLAVEEYRPGTKYIALSHVWADGLGNPKKNAIQECQVPRLAGLVSMLQKKMEGFMEGLTRKTEYRLWIDTLCCPVERSGKLIALGRITDVYRNATHVLVLDSSVSSYSSGNSSPAELLLRMFGTSTWMRRLWTFQGEFDLALCLSGGTAYRLTEGALGKPMSLCFQFSDDVIQPQHLRDQLFEIGRRDPRYIRIWMDITNEFRNLHIFGAPGLNEGPFEDVHDRLTQLQWGLYFRTVTKPSDEPLCLATLLSLNIRPITEADSHEDRMALVWQAISDLYKGVPARIIFYEDAPMQKVGFRWAPLSLLGPTHVSWQDTNAKVTRFRREGDDASSLGVSMPAGLLVKFPGARLEPRPLAEGLPLHPWEGVLRNPVEDMVYLRDEQANQWFRAINVERHMASISLPPDKMQDWDRKANSPICRDVHNTPCALMHDLRNAITDEASLSEQLIPTLMVSVEDSTSNDYGEALQVHKLRSLLVWMLSRPEAVVADGLRLVAGRVAEDEATRKLVAIRDKDGQKRKVALEEVKTRMKEAMVAYWDATPDFAQAVCETMGAGMRDWIWAGIPKFCSHDIVVTSLPEGQTWLVD